MLIQELKEMLDKLDNFQTFGKCVDCGIDVIISAGKFDDGDIAITGGALYKPQESYGYGKTYVCKCDNCFAVDSKLHQRTEVYTRCVGYLRPVSQMNPGKTSEIDQRKMFNMSTV